MKESTKAVREWRKKQKAKGLVRHDAWVHPDDWREVQALMDRLKRKRGIK